MKGKEGGEEKGDGGGGGGGNQKWTQSGWKSKEDRRRERGNKTGENYRDQKHRGNPKYLGRALTEQECVNSSSTHAESSGLE